MTQFRIAAWLPDLPPPKGAWGYTEQEVCALIVQAVNEHQQRLADLCHDAAADYERGSNEHATGGHHFASLFGFTDRWLMQAFTQAQLLLEQPIEWSDGDGLSRSMTNPSL